MNLRTAKRVLFAFLMIGIAAFFGLNGTFANFQAETDNNGSAIASGTLTMSDTVNSGSACFSTSAVSQDNINNACGQIFSVTGVAPGTMQGTQIAKVAVANTGTLSGTNLYMYASSPNGVLTAGLTQGNAVTTLTMAGGVEGTIASGDSITVSYGGHAQVFVVSATPTPAANSNGGATSLTVTSQNANANYPAGSTVVDFTANTTTTNTDCYDTKTAAGSAFTFNSITAATSGQAFNPMCGAIVMWVQELTGGHTYCWWGNGSRFSSGSSFAEDSQGRCVAPLDATVGGSGISGSGVTSIPVPSGVNGNINASDTIVVTQGSVSQSFTASSAVSVGATAIPINSATVSASFTGSAVGATITDTTAQGVLDAFATTDTLTNFDLGANSNARVELYPVTGNGAIDATTNHAADLSSGTTRTFYIGLYLPKPAGATQNYLQGISSTFGITWHLDQ
jgi:hypothetical protein